MMPMIRTKTMQKKLLFSYLYFFPLNLNVFRNRNIRAIIATISSKYEKAGTIRSNMGANNIRINNNTLMYLIISNNVDKYAWLVVNLGRPTICIRLVTFVSVVFPC